MGKTTALCSHCFQKARRGMNHCSKCGFNRKEYPIIEVDNKVFDIVSTLNRKGYTTTHSFGGSNIDGKYKSPSVTIKTDGLQGSNVWDLYSNEIINIMIKSLPKTITLSMNIVGEKYFKDIFEICGGTTVNPYIISYCRNIMIYSSTPSKYYSNWKNKVTKTTLEVIKDWADKLPDLKKLEKEELAKDVLDLWLMPHATMMRKDYM